MSGQTIGAAPTGADADRGTTDRPATTDGRRRRSERSRSAIVDAFLELLREGAQPSSTQIAERAGCTQRTVFNHFSDMDELLVAVAARQTERVLALLPAPTEGTFEERVADYAASLANMLEDTMHVRWAVLVAGAPTIAGIDVPRATHQMFRNNLDAAFGAELAALGDERRTAALDALDIVTDAAVWRIRRLHHGQSWADARAAVERALLDLLRPPG